MTRSLVTVLVLLLLIGCDGEKSASSGQIQYSHGVLTIPGVKSPDWPRAIAQTNTNARVRNVVLISIDTLRRDYVSAYGDPPDLPVTHATPHMDALAARGTLFLDAMAPAPTTGPSHHAIFSGLPAPVGKKLSFEQVIGGDVAHSIETLQAAGLQTAAFTGDGQMAPVYGWTVGFDEYTTVSFGTLGIDAMPMRELSQIQEHAFAWLEAHHEDAFFLFLHTYEVHCPYWPPAEQRQHYLSWYEGEAHRIECQALGHENQVDHTLAKALYAGSVAHADSFIGQLWSKLERLGRTRDTMIILLSDHGEQLGEDDGYIGHQEMHPSVMRIPLVVYIPGAQPGAESAAVSGIDVLPTIYSALGLQPPYKLIGQDLLPLIDRHPDAWPPQRLRFAHHGQDLAVFESNLQLTIRENPARTSLWNWRTGDPEVLQAHAETISRLRLEHQQMIESNQGLARQFRVVRSVQTAGSDPSDPAQDERMEQLRSLGYIQ